MLTYHFRERVLEANYQRLLIIFLQSFMSVQKVTNEQPNAAGRTDVIGVTKDHAFIFELRNHSDSNQICNCAETVLSQIRAGRYELSALSEVKIPLFFSLCFSHDHTVKKFMILAMKNESGKYKEFDDRVNATVCDWDCVINK